MRKNTLLAIVTLISLVVFVAVPLMATGCTRGAPSPAPAPKPSPAPAPAPAPSPAPAPAPAPAPSPKPSPAPAPSPATGPTVTLTFAFESSSGIRSYSVWPYRIGGIFEQHVTQLSGGRIKLDSRENLYSVTDTIFAAGDGRADLTNQLIPPINATYPLLDFGGLPGFFSGGVNAGSEWANALVDPRMRDVLNQYTRPAGFIVLGGMGAEGAYAFWGNKMITKVDDFKGAKIRTGGLAQTLSLRAVGASPLTIAAQELADALVRGTVDLSLTNLNHGQLTGLEDICKYISQWENFGIQFGRIVVINAKKFDSLPADLQKALLEAGRLHTLGSGMVVEQVVRDYEAMIKGKNKTQIYYPPKEELAKAAALMEGPIKEWLNKMGPLAPQVVKIAADYAKGPARDVVLKSIK